MIFLIEKVEKHIPIAMKGELYMILKGKRTLELKLDENQFWRKQFMIYSSELNAKNFVFDSREPLRD